MGRLLEELKRYLKDASPKQLEKDWEFIAQFDNCGPLATDFVKNCLQTKSWISQPCHTEFKYCDNKSRDFSGFSCFYLPTNYSYA